MRPVQILATAFALSSLSAAWPWPESLEYKGVGDFILIGRQDNNQNNQNNGGGNSNNGNSDNNNNNDNQNTNNGGGDNNNNPDNNNNNNNGGGDSKPTKGSKGGDGPKPTDPPKKGDSKGGDDKTTSSKTYGITVQPGSVTLLTPAMTDGSTLFAIGQPVTFGWNYTNLKATPTGIDVLASCSANSHMYTIAKNMKPGASGKAIWDTEKYVDAVSQLPMASYTLYIKDSDQSVTDSPDPGTLRVFNQFMFAMYSPQPYKGLADWDCPKCEVNAGIASVPAHQTLTLVIGMASLTILSFTWFATNRFRVL